MGEATINVKSDRLTQRLARCLRDLRHQAGWSLDELTERSGVSRATLSRLEHAEVSPTAQALSRIAGAYELPVSRLIRLAETEIPQVLSREEQALWEDASTGAEKRILSPGGGGYGSALVEGVLPQNVDEVLQDGAVGECHLVVLDGRLRVTARETDHDMRKGDSLRFHIDGPVTLTGASKRGTRYVMVTA